jgi:hypothetical protein
VTAVHVKTLETTPAHDIVETTKAELKRQTQDQNLRISSPKLHFFLQHTATKVLCTFNLSIKLFTDLQNFKVSQRL